MPMRLYFVAFPGNLVSCTDYSNDSYTNGISEGSNGEQTIYTSLALIMNFGLFGNYETLI